MTAGAPWRCTFTRAAFDLLAPTVEQCDIRDVAHALAYQCRYSGHTPVHYSVAEHSLRVAWLLMHREGYGAAVCLAGLLHDAAEAYVGDLPGPLKALPEMAGYRTIEAGIARVIERAFLLPDLALNTAVVHYADTVLLATEVRDVMGGEGPRAWGLREAPDTERIVPMTAEHAEGMFLAEYGRLQRTRGVRVGITGRVEVDDGVR